MATKVHEVCGACKGEFIFTGRKAGLRVREWRVMHKCEGPQFTYLFQTVEPPTYVEFDDEQD